ncbi:putative reticulon-like protein B17/18/21 [Helianthus debilis subsp. tardiflorus]
MDMERKRVAPNSSKTGVVMGSVWESRMKGSLKVFNGDDKIQETENKNNQSESFRSKQSPNGVGKRKTWKSDGNSEGNERSPVQISKVRSENKKELSDSIEGIGIKKSPVAVQVKKGRPEWNRVASVSIDGIERSPVQRSVKTRSLSRKVSTSSDLKDVIDECNDGIQERDGGNRGDDEGKNNTSDCSQSLDVCEEKLMMVELKRVKSLDSEEDSDKVTLEKNEEVNEERAIVIVKEPEPEPEPEPVLTIHKKKSSDVVIEEKKIHHRNERSNLVSKTVRKQLPPVVNHQKTSSKPNEFPSQRVPKSHSKLQSLIDLIMWKDASKSALVFGFGTFSILSSSYTQDLNISFISVISYLSLIYLAATFIFKSFILRGVVQSDNITDDDEYVVGEEEAIWALKLFLPYINEFLLKVKALFSGDPATTMKMAVLLFILARCGSSITIWKMAKLAFFGLFTVPKICSSYSSQLSAYGAFWIQRFKDAWDSCSQKKAVAFGVFTLVWNLSSMVARIWAVFMLLVAFKFYQQSMTKDDQVVEEEEPIIHRNQSSWQEQRNGRIFASTESTKFKKRS